LGAVEDLPSNEYVVPPRAADGRAVLLWAGNGQVARWHVEELERTATCAAAVVAPLRPRPLAVSCAAVSAEIRGFYDDANPTGSSGIRSRPT
jgi:hypothetical protein